MEKLAEKNKKTVPEPKGKIDPARVPQPGQPEAEEVSLEMLVIGYKGVRIPKSNIYYEKAGALEVAKKLVTLARTEGVDFMNLVKEYSDLPDKPQIPVLRKSDDKLPPFLQGTFVLKQGQISDPVDSHIGYLIFKRTTLELAKASHILVAYKGAMRSQQSRSKAEAKQRAEEVLKNALAGKDFAELAKQYSDGPSAKSGGELGSFARGQMVPAFENAVFQMKAGVNPSLIETPFGYHIIKREE
ncbi:peptidylprolyl isomerase [Deltaproteobacteria bacterium TL4]